MASLRHGVYGSYYGSLYTESQALTTEQMQTNATYIYSCLLPKGWTINAISAILGNMQAESSINPGRWQSDSVGWVAGGYGLVQWTPTTKYIDWCTAQGFSDPSEMDNNLERILWEVDNGDQWGFPSYSPYTITFKQFTISNESVSDLTKAFLLNYERPAEENRTEEKQAIRASLGEAWYEYLTGVAPTPPTPTTDAPKKRFNFVLFNMNRRGNTWKKKNLMR